MRLISQLITRISRFLQNVFKHFNGTTILTRFILPSAGILPVIFVSDFNDSESAQLTFGLSL